MRRTSSLLTMALLAILCLSITACKENMGKGEKPPNEKPAEAEGKSIIGIDIEEFLNKEEGGYPSKISGDIRKNLIAPLMKLAAGKREDDYSTPKEIAIDLLGEFRVVDAVGMLVDDIDYYPPGFGGGELPVMHFPCAKALINIGLPSIEPIFERLRNEEFNEKHYILYAWVIHLIFDNELSSGEMGEYRIKKELEREKIGEDNYYVKRLQKLLEVYKAKSDCFAVTPFEEKMLKETGQDQEDEDE